MVLTFVERTADNQNGAADGLPTTGHGSPDMQSGEVCRQLFEQYGCGSPWTMSESSEPAVFEIAAQQWWVFKRGPSPKPNSAEADWIRFYHGTTLDIAIKIMSEGFLIGDGRHCGTLGMFGISTENGNKDEISQCICRRLAVDRAKVERSQHTRNGYPIDAWATPVAFCFLFRQGTTKKLSSFKNFKRADIQKKCFAHEFEGQRLGWTTKCYIEVHIPSRQYVRTQNMAYKRLTYKQSWKCEHCNCLTRFFERKYICPECFCWHNRLQL